MPEIGKVKSYLGGPCIFHSYPTFMPYTAQMCINVANSSGIAFCRCIRGGYPCRLPKFYKRHLIFIYLAIHPYLMMVYNLKKHLACLYLLAFFYHLLCHNPVGRGKDSHRLCNLPFSLKPL